MTYNPAIPQANDIIAQSQSQIQTNFSQADLIFDVNHVTFDDATAADRGKHRQIDFTRLVADPGSDATQLALYEKLSGTSSELFFQRDNVATVTQLTGGGITAAAWCQFNGNTAGTNPPTQGFNVTSVQRVSAGSYVLNYTRNFTTTTYAIVVFPSFNSTGVTVQIGVRNAADTSFLIRNGAAVATDSGDINVVVFGILA
jgi:hypothetical protein